MNNPACSNCGAPLNPTAAACSRCGIPMSQMPGHDQPQNQFNYQLQGEQPSPGPQDYSGKGYGNQGRGSQAYGGPAYGHQAYGIQAYGGPVYGVGHPQGKPGAGTDAKRAGQGQRGEASA